MENFGNFIKSKVSIKLFLSRDALRAAIKKARVKEISPENCCKLIDSMPAMPPAKIIKQGQSHRILVAISFNCA